MQFVSINSNNGNSNNHNDNVDNNDNDTDSDRDRDFGNNRASNSSSNSNHSSHSNTSLQVNQDEEFARILQRRDSLLQQFDIINTFRSSQHQHHHSLTSAFDINALRQRASHQSSSRHRHSQSQSHSTSDSLVRHLPIRKVQESDIAKGDESTNLCSICQEKFNIGDQVKTLPCFHFFHVTWKIPTLHFCTQSY